MTDRFSPGRLGDWVIFCDICGQKCFASEATRLTQYTGRGSLIVCPNDVDAIDYGLIPYEVPVEQNLPWTRINHTDTTNSAFIIDHDEDQAETAGEGMGIVLSQDECVAITTSQDNEWIETSQEN